MGPSAVGLLVVVLLLAVVGAAHGGGGDATLSGEVALGSGGSGAVDGNVVLESTLGRSGVLGTWRGDVGGGGSAVTRRPTSCLLPEVLEEFQTTSTQP